MPFHERLVHLYMAACMMLAAVCAIRVANESTTSVEILVWLFTWPVIAISGHAASQAFGRGEE